MATPDDAKARAAAACAELALRTLSRPPRAARAMLELAKEAADPGADLEEIDPRRVAIHSAMAYRRGR